MNTKNNQLFTSLSKEETKSLTTVVNETIALDAMINEPFTAADLWNIQRSRRSTLQRRHYA